MKRLITIVALLSLMVSGVWFAFAADVDQTPVWEVGPPIAKDSYCVYHFVVTDSNTFDVADTSVYFPMNPWGTGGQFPDAVTLFGVYTEVGANSAACGDSMLFHIDICMENDSTSLSKASADWAPISATSGSYTYASRTGKSDTLKGITEAGSGVQVYSLTAAQLATPAPYFRIRWNNAEGASTAATDSFNVDWYVMYKRTLYK